MCYKSNYNGINMTSPNQNDILVRSQQLTGLISNKTIHLQKKLSLGEECCCEWKDLQILIMMYDVIKCFCITTIPPVQEVNAIPAIPEIVGVGASLTILFQSGITGPVSTSTLFTNIVFALACTGPIVNIFMAPPEQYNMKISEYATYLNNYGSSQGITAVYQGSNKITITLPVSIGAQGNNGGAISSGITGSYQDPSDGRYRVAMEDTLFSEGVTKVPATLYIPAIPYIPESTTYATNNCLTITQIEKMFNYIEKRYNFSFPPYQTNYIVSNTIVYEDYRITEDGTQRDIENNNLRITE